MFFKLMTDLNLDRQLEAKSSVFIKCPQHFGGFSQNFTNLTQVCLKLV